MDKLRLATVHAEEDAALARGGKDPFIVVKAPSASKGGVAETSIKVSMFCISLDDKEIIRDDDSITMIH